ncbi:MAG: small multi-drug export protein [Clostridia bacterium]|nr:small multi-drug export protein [Clostridia bacterium]NCC42116.1 small multi-drug export protein [Clostridia bacterium]
MQSLVTWFTNHLGPYISPQALVFIISLLPLLELRGGLLAGTLLKVPVLQAIPISIIGNIIPIPFILLFIKQIFKWLKKVKVFRGIIEKLEKRAMGKSSALEKGEFIGLMLFVGIPLPGTGAWTGALIASLLGIDIKKSSLAILCGIAIATVIMYFVSYVLVGNMVS